MQEARLMEVNEWLKQHERVNFCNFLLKFPPFFLMIFYFIFLLALSGEV